MRDPQVPRPGWEMWKRFLLAGMLVVLLSATATATAGLLEVDEYSDIIREEAPGPRLKIPELSPEERGPQTILLMGSDVRKDERRRGLKGNSDTMILVRLDPTKQATALLSIPRDLRIRIPGVTPPKINGAYPVGGVRLTVRAIEQALPGIEINHVINTNFRGFKAAVNKVGCLYLDVDRRYFNDNPIAYAEINVKPGYQRLCGGPALDYVRYRHEDTDIVRGARQQDFIRQARNQVGVQSVLSDRKEFLRLFARYTDTDIRGTRQILRLLKVVAFSAGHPIREVRFRANVGPSYVTATSRQIQQTVDEFLDVDAAAGGPRERNRPAPLLRTQRRRRSPQRSLAALNLEEAKAAGEEQGVDAAANVRFPVLFPRLRVAGSIYVDVPRTYVVTDPGGRRHQAYRMVVRTGELGAYYGIQGITWRDPPILASPTGERTIAGRKYYLYGDGNRLRLVAIRTPRGSYWVSNTLLLSLNNRQMLAIARSLQQIGARPAAP
jgi:polyisoprenyl-teichoic acid--peptidoglycan teichoic acid transferase